MCTHIWLFLKLALGLSVSSVTEGLPSVYESLGSVGRTGKRMSNAAPLAVSYSYSPQWSNSQIPENSKP